MSQPRDAHLPHDVVEISPLWIPMPDGTRLAGRAWMPAWASAERPVPALLELIPYRTRDLTRLLPPTARSFRRMGKITGRSDDMLIIRGVNVFPSQIEEQILKVPRLSTHYMLEVSRQGHLDELDVLVEMKPDVVSEADREAAAHELQHHIKSLIGISTLVRIQHHGSIERSQGKARRVIDRRPK